MTTHTTNDPYTITVDQLDAGIQKLADELDARDARTIGIWSDRDAGGLWIDGTMTALVGAVEAIETLLPGARFPATDAGILVEADETDLVDALSRAGFALTGNC